MKTKLFLDDIRNPPDDSWEVVRTAKEAITVLSVTIYDELSLDHDLGDDVNGTGYDVVKWMEEMVASEPFYQPPASIVIHSANPVGRKNMQAGIDSIMRMLLARVR